MDFHRIGWALISAICTIATAQNAGDLDTAWGFGGYVIERSVGETYFPTSHSSLDRLHFVAALDDGGILAIGDSLVYSTSPECAGSGSKRGNPCSYGALISFRYQPNGLPFPGYANAGANLFGYGDGDSSFEDAIHEGDGQALVLYRNEYRDFANQLRVRHSFIRIEGDGDRDNSVVWPYANFEYGGNWQSNHKAMALQGGQHIVTAGYLYDPQSYAQDILISRFDLNGQIDTSFGANGTGHQSIHLSDPSWAMDVAIQDDGRILVFGGQRSGISVSGLTIRLDANGIPDPSFGTNGIALSNDGLMGGMVLHDGSLLGWNPFSLVRHTPTGTLDLGFGTSGYIDDPYHGSYPILDVAQASDGHLLVGGYSNHNGYRDTALMVGAFNHNGVLDHTFGYSGQYGRPGLASSYFSLTHGNALAIVPSQDRVVAAGYYYYVTGNPPQVGNDEALTMAFRFHDGNYISLVDRLLAFRDGLLTRFRSGVIYHSPDGKRIGGGGDTQRAYGGDEPTRVLMPYADGIYAVFDDDPFTAYYSVDGTDLRGGAQTNPETFSHRIVAMVPYHGDVLTAFDNGTLYVGNPQQGLQHVMKLSGSDRVLSMTAVAPGALINYRSQRVQLITPGSISTVYSGSTPVRLMAAYKQGVMTVLANKATIFYSPDCRDLVGTSALKAYTGSIPVDTMMEHNGSIYSAFKGAGIYLSPDGTFLGGGGGTTKVYGGTQRVLDWTVTHSGKIVTAFSGGGVYLSPTGTNLGGGGKTKRIYFYDDWN